MNAIKNRLLKMYNKMYSAFGPQYWWPGETPFEIIIGAILTQNTAWSNVEKAIKNLKGQRLLNICSLSKISPKKLAVLIQPSGYYNIKVKRIMNLIKLINKDFGGSLRRFLNLPEGKLRSILLGVNGIGKETADSIILYAAQKPIFVIDAYTKRILIRHSLADNNSTYDQLQELFMNNLPLDVSLYNEYHALLVRVGKTLCSKERPKCNNCPLKGV